MTTSSLTEIAQDVLARATLFVDERSPFAGQLTAGNEKLLVVTGDNASGKSLLVQVLGAFYRRDHDGGTPVSLSIRERTGAGLSEMAGFRRTMMFGDESEQSTGATSVQSIRAAFEKNLDREEGSMLILDEPEMGLAEPYARTLGTYIAQQSQQLAENCTGVVVITHSRPLVKGLTAVVKPSHLAMYARENGAPQALGNWLSHPPTYTVEELLALKETGFARWRIVNDILKDAKAKK